MEKTNFIIRMERSLHTAIKERAFKDGISMGMLVRNAIEKYLKKSEKK